jgi:hypothetical protein
MKYIVLNTDQLGIDMSNGMPHDFELQLIAAGAAGHIPLDMPKMINNSHILIVRDCDVNKVSLLPDAIVYQTDSDGDWQIWLEANTVQESVI